jgi:hypothetical protein
MAVRLMNLDFAAHNFLYQNKSRSDFSKSLTLKETFYKLASPSSHCNFVLF